MTVVWKAPDGAVALPMSFRFKRTAEAKCRDLNNGPTVCNPLPYEVRRGIGDWRIFQTRRLDWYG